MGIYRKLRVGAPKSIALSAEMIPEPCEPNYYKSVQKCVDECPNDHHSKERTTCMKITSDYAGQDKANQHARIC